MKKIEEYMLLSKEERQQHLKLSEACIDRGGKEVSTYMKGLLAHILDTTLPLNGKVLVCHACNNPGCSNPYHIYWGTQKENSGDAVTCGANKGVWNYTVAKYGEEEARRLLGIGKQNNGVDRIKYRDPNYAGVKNSQFGTIWLKKEGKEIKIKKNEIHLFVTEGWERGRIKNPIAVSVSRKATWL